MPRYNICTSHKSTYILYRQKLKKEWNNWHNNISLFRIYKFFPAIIIALLGIKEVLCKEEEAKEESPRSHLKPKVENSSKQAQEAKSDTGTVVDIKKSVGKEDKSHPNEILPGKKSSEEIEIQPRKNSKIGTSIGIERPVYKEKSICCNDTPLTLKIAIETSRSYISRKMIEDGAPGASVAVSIDGKVVWSEGIGYSDVENSIRMSSTSVLRVASISKSLTMVAVGQLIEEGKLDLDAPIQKYVPTFPKKIVDGEEVTITTRHLLNHTSGIRHYRLTQNKKSKDTEKEEENEEDKPNETDEKSCKGDLDADLKLEQKKEKLRKLISKKLFQPKKRKEFDDEFTLDEYYIKEEFTSVKDALKLFQDDDLLFKPGEGYCYSTHGFTLVSAVVEALREKAFDRVMKDLFTSLSLRNTFLDQHTPLIFRRARNYIRDARGKLLNAPYVDNSYKWAGGGFLSTVMDLLNFGNAMLYSYQATEEDEQKGFLKSSTMDLMWASPRPPPPAKSPSRYNLGWCVTDEEE
ncbi:UNVERIFIED_CONTAM: hypothetical protein GTU68_063889, partial [Idotea baltica]|nr:hypothetical protein [Idotea baltica]